MLARNGGVILILIFFFLSCQRNALIERNQFKDILYKIHECEAYNELKYENENTAFLQSCKYSVLEDYHVHPHDFETTVRYYRDHSDEFEKIYDTLISRSESNPAL